MTNKDKLFTRTYSVAGMVARGCLDSIQYRDGDTERDKMVKVVVHRLLESQKETE